MWRDRMKPVRTVLRKEVHNGQGVTGEFYLSDCREQLDRLLETHAGRIKSIYMDPPYLTGDKFCMRARVGEADWKSNRSSLKLSTFSDQMDRTSYLEMMRDVITKCRELLSTDGMLFLHIDYRTQPYLRLLLDEIFGEENFRNEIIWAYQSGGRATRHFSRKHDVILFYSRGTDPDFNLEEVMVKPNAPRGNHMRKHVDPDGRVYRSIKVNGKLYTYYDDDPVAPSDVWSDVSHLQQKDPERTGYDTQKPKALLDRILRCSSRSGDLVLDPFCGSGTTLEAAKSLGRNFIGIDSCGVTSNIIRRRLQGCNFSMNLQENGIEPECDISILQGVGFFHVTLEHFTVPLLDGDMIEGMDIVDNWSVGFIAGDEYHVSDEYIRNRKTPAFKNTLDIPAFGGTMAMCVNDIYGRSFLYEIRA